jgi:hypothetical protein
MMEKSTGAANSRLEWSLRALAQPALVQVGLFPSFVECADELALDFDESLELLSEKGGQPEIDEQQRRAIEAVDAQLQKMSTDQGRDYWSNESLANSVEWARVRSLARDALLALGLSTSPPPPTAAVYVPDGR